MSQTEKSEITTVDIERENKQVQYNLGKLLKINFNNENERQQQI